MRLTVQKHLRQHSKPDFSKERRLEPQITVGLLSDAKGFPLSVGAYEGNMAETRTMLPMIRRFQDAYNLDDVTIVADAGMFSQSNKDEIVKAGLGYIIRHSVQGHPLRHPELAAEQPRRGV